ncbi:MAG: hypothetical protein WBM41_11675 [Arenicellales bacterium]
MKRVVALCIYLVALSHSQGLMAGSNSQTVIASGNAAQLTQDAFEAYFEALQFCLDQIGTKSSYGDEEKQQIQGLMISAFPTLPPETQQALATARETWQQYQAAWPVLGMDQKKAFAFDVLGLAYGEAAAAEALGIPYGSASSNGSASGYYPGPEVTEEYSKAYSGGIDQGDGTYEFETYNSSSGTYDYSYE